MSSAKCSQLQFRKFIIVAVNHNLQQHKQSIKSALFCVSPSMKWALIMLTVPLSQHSCQTLLWKCRSMILRKSKVSILLPQQPSVYTKKIALTKVNKRSNVGLICNFNGLGGPTCKIYPLSSNMPVPWKRRKHHECTKFGCSSRKCNIHCAQCYKQWSKDL